MKRLHKRRRYKAISFSGLEIPWEVGASGVKDLDGIQNLVFRECTYRRPCMRGRMDSWMKSSEGFSHIALPYVQSTSTFGSGF